MQVSEWAVERTDRETTSDVDLVRQAQAGARSAFDRLVTQHAPAVVRTAYMIVGDADEAEDVAQETFIAAYRNLNSYQPTAPFAAWLHRIAINRGYDHLRRRRRQRVLVDEIAAGSAASEQGDALNQVRADEQSAAVRELIAGLDDKNRVLVTLRFLHELSIKEVAATLELPEGTVKRRLHDVLKTLRKRVGTGALP